MDLSRPEWRFFMIAFLSLFFIFSYPGTVFSVEAPDFTLPSLTGDAVSLSDFQGHPVILSFFMARCLSCNQEALHLNAIYQEYHASHSLVVVGIGLGPEIDDFVERNGITYPILLDENEDIAWLFEVCSVPNTFFIDRNGHIITQLVGPLEQEMREEYLELIIAPDDSPSLPVDTDFSLPNLDGIMVSLSDFLGHPVILAFFPDDSPEYNRVAVQMEEIYREYHESHGLVVLGIGVGPEIDQLNERNGITYPVLLDETGDIAWLLDVHSELHFFFLNREGQFLAQHPGIIEPEKLEEYVELIIGN